MAARKRKSTAKKKKASRKNLIFGVFWVVFIVVMAILFIVNIDEIRNTLNSLPVPAETEAQSGSGELSTEPAEPTEPPESVAAPLPPEQQETPPGTGTTVPTQARKLYFVRVDAEGKIIYTPVEHQVETYGAPLAETLGALLSGPSPEEEASGIRTLIPPETRLINVSISKGTANINLNESFKFNSYSQEGYMWSLRQLVWTATEFPTVNNVQILIDGKKNDYLGEGIWINKPLGREAF
ncbi:MAG: GerMN domain-containing protein [Spirochaetaceae bacterium]|jgi:spore germination protein GerM|nr:GerMN domain-containing protein [Spirochaetaceae bacterium]